MKKLLLALCVLLSTVILVESYFLYANHKRIIIPFVKVPTPLLAYAFPTLKKTTIPKSQIMLGKTISETPTSFSQLFYYFTPQKPTSKRMERVSGLMNIPKSPGNHPVIIMFRGFVPQNIYAPGIGTQPVAQVLVNNGFITLAPDFLGYGTSSPGATESFENRFQVYTTALSMLSSINTLNVALSEQYQGTISADLTHIGIWGHSNGGHIALATLALSGVTYPTVLWAPVSASFPYSILYYTDESDDQGKVVRKLLSQFEETYNTDLFSPPLYYKWIKSPIQINQGTNDQEVPFWWSDNLVATLKKNGNDVTYNTYPNADHNMLPSSTWSTAVINTENYYKAAFGQ